MSNFLLVPLASVKRALHIDAGETDDDTLLEFLISAASRAVVRYIKGNASEYLSIDSPPNSPPDDLSVVPEDIAQAIIILTAIWYRNPDHDTEGNFNDDELPAPVKALLKPFRTPTLA